MANWQEKHGEVLTEFVGYLNNVSDDFVLKGGTAIHLCYGLDRFSEDVDLDGMRKGLIDVVDSFCAENGYDYRVGKDTQTVERCFIHYGEDGHPLKIEASFRNAGLAREDTVVVEGIRTYDIDTLCTQKTLAYTARDKIRDAYDVSFIYANYKSELSPKTIETLKTAIAYKGLEQFDYLVETQKDELINNDVMAGKFLDMCDGLGLFFGEDGVDYNIDISDDVENEPDNIDARLEYDPDDDDSKSSDWND